MLEIRRNQVFASMKENSVAVILSGKAKHRSADAYHPYVVDNNFFYLTGLERENMYLVLVKTNNANRTMLFIEEANPAIEKWIGKKMLKSEATAISGIDEVFYIDQMDMMLNRIYGNIANLYIDGFRNSLDDELSFGAQYGNRIKELYPYLKIKNVFPTIAAMRMVKDEKEVNEIKKAIQITKEGIEKLMSNAKDGMLEYQLQSIYEQHLAYNGTRPSFPTIAATGLNATTLHYVDNNAKISNDDLILFDLGTNYHNYCSDITRTFPVGGKFSAKQKEIYEIVLEANKMVIENAKPGITTLDLQNMTKEVLAKGLKRLGLIKEDSELIKYYMHGVSHHLGLDVHDVTNPAKAKLEAGMIITNEPGLYIEELSIGIRIEDDLLITKDGCINLSQDIIKEVADIEAFMSK